MNNDHFANSILNVCTNNNLDISKDLLSESNKTLAQLIHEEKETKEEAAPSGNATIS